jgi:hypothetical protein
VIWISLLRLVFTSSWNVGQNLSSKITFVHIWCNFASKKILSRAHSVLSAKVNCRYPECTRSRSGVSLLSAGLLFCSAITFLIMRSVHNCRALHARLPQWDTSRRCQSLHSPTCDLLLIHYKSGMHLCDIVHTHTELFIPKAFCALHHKSLSKAGVLSTWLYSRCTFSMKCGSRKKMNVVLLLKRRIMRQTFAYWVHGEQQLRNNWIDWKLLAKGYFQDNYFDPCKLIKMSRELVSISIKHAHI